MPSHRGFWTVVGSAFVVLALILATILHWGGYLLVRSDVLPSRADGAVILQASLPSENARIAGAAELLKRGVVDRVLLSIPETGYWGVSLPALARVYLQKQYGDVVSSRFGFCITGPQVDSTEAEAGVLIPCIQEQHWHSVIVVTSNFHSRRARIVWRKVCERLRFPGKIYIDGVADPLFDPHGWWRERKFAKTWFFETTKLIWTFIGR